jgi:hypothetical protein
MSGAVKLVCGLAPPVSAIYVAPLCSVVSMQVARGANWKTPSSPFPRQPAIDPSPAPMSEVTTAM